MKVLLNPFTGTLVTSDMAVVKSIPLEIYNTDDSEYSGAVEAVEFNQKVYKFSQGLEQSLRMRFKIPDTYIKSIIKLSITAYTPSTTDTFQFSLRSTLYNKDVDAVGSGLLYNDYDSGVITNSTPSNLLRKFTIDINDAAFQIGSTDLIAGSIIDCRLLRDTLVSGDDADDVRIIPHIEVVRY